MDDVTGLTSPIIFQRDTKRQRGATAESAASMKIGARRGDWRMRGGKKGITAEGDQGTGESEAASPEIYGIKTLRLS